MPDTLAREAVAPAPVAVTVHAARLVYDGAPLFDELDFTLSGGRWTCLLGPSGVGKTTLIRLIAGLTPAATGTRVTCSDGQPLAGRVAWMGQQDLLLPWLSALNNTLLGSRLRGESDPGGKRRARAIDLLIRVGLGDKLSARPAALSGGQRQRVALVRTLMEDRPVILMDEPFSALDSVTRWKLQELAAELLAGRTVLLVTHSPREALRLGHRIHVMAGRPARLDHPLTLADDTPRPLDTGLLGRETELIRRLAAAAEAP